jgi:hypothetical protein
MLKQLTAEAPTPYGFGQVLGCNAKKPLLSNFLAQPRPALVVPPSDSDPDRGTRLLPEAAPPVGRFLTIVTLFAMAVGPGSFWIVRKRGPALLLLTLPGAALITSTVMIASAFLGSGLRTQASTRSLALLDNERGRVITVGMGGFFSGRTPGDLRLSNSASWFLGNASQLINSGYTLRSGYIPGRTYTEAGMVAVVPTRARLQIKEEGKHLEVQNALGAYVKRAYVRRGRTIWETGEIADGGEGAARPSAFPTQPDWPLPASHKSRVFEHLEDGEFLALAEGPGFLPLGDQRLDHHRSESWIRGKVQR